MIARDEADMLAIGTRIGEELKGGELIAIDGPLGAGKTVLCRGILRGLGFTGDVASPSYSIVHEYHPPELRLPVLHVDLYRVEEESELEELGLEDDLGNAVQIIEWASRFETFTRRASRRIQIELSGDGERKITVA